MKEFDFVFVYEVKNRELENDSLIACELEKRGYKVGFIETWDQEIRRERPLKTKVAIAFAMYSDRLLDFIDYHVLDCDRYLNMQWEQVFTNRMANRSVKDLDTNKELYFGVSGKALKAVHIAWGEKTYERLTKKFNVPHEKVAVTGHPALDFLRPELRGYFMPRENLFGEFGIPADRKTFLFISSFSYTTLPAATLDMLNNSHSGLDVYGFAKISIDSQKEVLSWVARTLSENSDINFIYRPHPAENQNELLKELQKKYPNFYVIDKYAINQWIVTTDKVYTWFSTSVAELFAAKKDFDILRPYELPYADDLETYNGARTITDYEGFRASLFSESQLPVDPEVMRSYYKIDPDYPTYMQICDVLEKIYHDDSYRMNCEHKMRTDKTRRQYNRYMFLKKIFVHFSVGRRLLTKLYPNRNNDLDNYKYTLAMYKKNHSTEKERLSIMERIRSVIG